MLKNFIVFNLLSLFVTAQAFSNEIQKVSKGKILFTTSKMKKFGVGTVVQVTDGDQEIARAKVIKVGKSRAVARLFNNDSPVFKGYKVKIIVFKKPSKTKRTRKGSVRKKKPKAAIVPRKFAILGGAGLQSMGALSGAGSEDPTGFGSYQGLKGELNYRFSYLLGAFVGLDYFFATEGVSMPATSFSAEEFKATGSISDISIGAQYYLDRFGFEGYFVSGMFLPIAGHKITKEFASSTFQNVFTGTGLGLGVGKEWIIGSWLIQANGVFKSYSFTSREDNTSAPAESVTIGQAVINLNLMLGYHF